MRYNEYLWKVLSVPINLTRCITDKLVFCTQTNRYHNKKVYKKCLIIPPWESSIWFRRCFLPMKLYYKLHWGHPRKQMLSTPAGRFSSFPLGCPCLLCFVSEAQTQHPLQSKLIIPTSILWMMEETAYLKTMLYQSIPKDSFRSYGRAVTCLCWEHLVLPS